jgi:predicted metal-binding membrane protein
MSTAGHLDTPRTAYRVLERRATQTIVAVLLALAGLAWWWTVHQAADMKGMAQGLGSVGVAMPFDMSAVVFMAMWTTMMVAMMLPTVAPIILLHRMAVRRRGEGTAPTVAFAGGYLLVWGVLGVVPFTLLITFRHVADGSAWVASASGAVLIAAGAYQFTRWKDTCQKACRSPMNFLMTHDFGRGARGAIRTGVSHGLYCLGCCWALMAVLFVVGLMNLAWMAGIAVVFIAEKNWRHGATLTKLAGIAVIGIGIAVLVHPALLTSIAPGGGTEMTQTTM